MNADVNVLLVEDDTVQRELVQDILTNDRLSGNGL